MKNKIATVLSVMAALLVVLCTTGPVEAGPPARPDLQGGAPTVVSYQGRVTVGSNPYDGPGYFKFAIVNAGASTTYWSNDGTPSGEPTNSVRLTVTNGLFNVLLGDTTLDGMSQSLTAEDFEQPDCYLRVWFSPDGNTYEWLDPDRRIAAVPYALQAQEAADADTVDGLHASELETHYQNVVVVAKSGGDYTSVQAAIDSITDAAADNAYLVWVAPGVYNETVTMKPYVHLQGAGQEATVITSTAGGVDFPPPATLLLANDTSLRDLTVGNGGTSDYNTALLATAGMTRTLVADVTARVQGSGVFNYAIVLIGDDVGVTLQQVTALAENSSNNFGLVNYSGAQATLRGGFFTARGGTDACGIHNADGATTLEAESVIALGENASNNNYGLWNVGTAAATLRGGSYTGRGGSQARGIDNEDSSTTLEAENVTVLAEDGSNSNYGLFNYIGAAVTLRGGSYTGRGGSSARGIYNVSSGTTLEATGIAALAENGSSTNQGLYNSATAILYGGSFTGRGGGATALGIYNYGSSATLEAESVTMLGENGSSVNHGLSNNGSATANVTQSVLQGATNSVNCITGSVTVSNSRLAGGAVFGTVTCVAVSRGTTFNANGCP